MICKICNKEVSIKGISSHLRHSHSKTVKEYYDTYLKQPNEGICICGKETTFYGMNGYAKHCSVKCSMNDEKTTEKRISTNIEKYGVANPYQSELVKNKIKNTWLKKYGVDNPNKVKAIRSKITQTNLNRYGAKVSGKSKSTLKEKYGYEYPNQNPEIMNKVILSKQQTISAIEQQLNCTHVKKLVELYGSGWYQTNLAKQICFKKSGFTFVSNDNIKEIQLYNECDGSYLEYLTYKYLKSHNIDFDHQTIQIIKPYELDFYIDDLRIGIECNGYFHYKDCKIIDRDQDKYHQLKLDLCNKNNIQLININCENDLVILNTIF